MGKVFCCKHVHDGMNAKCCMFMLAFVVALIWIIKNKHKWKTKRKSNSLGCCPMCTFWHANEKATASVVDFHKPISCSTDLEEDCRVWSHLMSIHGNVCKHNCSFQMAYCAWPSDWPRQHFAGPERRASVELPYGTNTLTAWPERCWREGEHRVFKGPPHTHTHNEHTHTHTISSNIQFYRGDIFMHSVRLEFTNWGICRTACYSLVVLDGSTNHTTHATLTSTNPPSRLRSLPQTHMRTHTHLNAHAHWISTQVNLPPYGGCVAVFSLVLSSPEEKWWWAVTSGTDVASVFSASYITYMCSARAKST